MNQSSDVTAAVLVIGNEILSGRTSDRNINLIARFLGPLGIELREVRVVADEEAAIIAAVNALRTRFDYVFSTGGIGPTHDDITADSMAAAFDVGIDVDPRAVEMMRARYRAEELVGDRLRMARIPHGADLIANPVSTAPGFVLGNVFVMAGIPAVMSGMLEQLTPRLRHGAPILARTVRVIALESAIATPLRNLQKENPDVAIGSYPFVEEGVLGAHLVLRCSRPERLTEVITELQSQLMQAGHTCSEVSEKNQTTE